MAPVSKEQVLQDTTFGKRVAEEEVDELGKYFVETDQWRRIYTGEVDIVYGTKGAGKSAIYALLNRREDHLFDEHGVMIVPAENPRGATAFGSLTEDPPTSERELRELWKLYLLSLIADHLRDYGICNDDAKQITSALENAGLLQKQVTLRARLRSALDYVRSWFKAESLEGGLRIDPVTGTPIGLSGKIVFREPSAEHRDFGLISVDDLLERAEAALKENEVNLWLLLDRLDVAFAETEELERNALRALFRVYLDLIQYSRISLKIFLRSDIWERIRGEGFREASHITKSTTIKWDKTNLLNLVIRRLLHNTMLREAYDVNFDEVLSDSQRQEEFFYRLFPRQVDVGSRNPDTLGWIISRTGDPINQTAPRELIHFLSSAREEQLQRLETGLEEPPEEALFERGALKEALKPVSRVRFEQTLCAEHPTLEPWLNLLDGQKTEQTVESLMKVWDVDRTEASSVAEKLVEIGFFEKRKAKEVPTYWVPFIYRDALEMV